MVRARCLLVAVLLSNAAAAVAQPPACGAGGAFPDVPQNHPFCAWIQQLAADQIATSCDGTNYCPDAPVTRAQLALFVYKLTRGTATSQVDADTLDGNDSSNFITGVTASGGLSGGGSSGDIGVSIADDGVTSAKIDDGTILFADLAQNGCVDGEAVQRSGGAWACVAAGDITAVTTVVDSGLAGGAASGAASLSIPTGGVNSARIENGTILFEDLAANGCSTSNVIQRSGSNWVCGSIATPVVFVHTVTNLNTAAPFTIIDNAAVNNSATVKLFVTLDNTNGAGPNAVVAVRRIDLGPVIGTRWVIEMMNGGTPALNSTYNVLVMP